MSARNGRRLFEARKTRQRSERPSSHRSSRRGLVEAGGKAGVVEDGEDGEEKGILYEDDDDVEAWSGGGGDSASDAASAEWRPMRLAVESLCVALIRTLTALLCDVPCVAFVCVFACVCMCVCVCCVYVSCVCVSMPRDHMCVCFVR